MKMREDLDIRMNRSKGLLEKEDAGAQVRIDPRGQGPDAVPRGRGLPGTSRRFLGSRAAQDAGSGGAVRTAGPLSRDARHEPADRGVGLGSCLHALLEPHSPRR